MKNYLILLILIVSSNFVMAEGYSKISVGRTVDDVISILGSPDAKTFDSENSEVWVYNNVKNFDTYNNSSFAVDKPLTVVLKFGKNNRIVNFSYFTN